jgi:predicted nuclease with TOPRIM domain
MTTPEGHLIEIREAVARIAVITEKKAILDEVYYIEHHLRELEQGALNPEYFTITQLHRDDIHACFKNEPELLKKADKLNDGDMEEIASLMCDDYLNQLYWSSLDILARSHIEEMTEREEQAP